MQYTVEACITNDCHIMNTYLAQQFLTDLVLDEEMCKTLQYMSILTSIPLEEHLFRTEDTGHAIYWHITVTKYMKVVIPEFVLDEERHLRTDGTQEAACIGNSVQRQISDNVGTFVVLPHLIAGWREECQEYLVFGMVTTQLFHQWASLFKLSERCSMKPYITSIRVNLLTQYANGIALALPHLLHLLIEK